MPINKIAKITGLNVGIATFNTVLFSPGLLGVQIGGASIFATAFGITAIFMSIAIFAFGNYKLITEKEKDVMVLTSQIKTSEEYVTALKLNYSKKTFEKDIDIVLEQIVRIHKKKETINSILLQKFNPSEMSFSKFEGIILAIEEVFYINIRSILNKLNAFDEVDYNRVRKSEKISVDIRQTKMSIFDEYITFVKNAIDDNEEILLKLDKLLLEISNLNSLEGGQIEKMSIMSEIDDLINQTKYYKEQNDLEGKGTV